MINSWKIRELMDKATNMVMNYTETEAKVREATNDDPWGPSGSLMTELAQATFTYEQFPEVMQMLWRRMLQENKSNWRRTYKSLILLCYLVRNGSERVVTSARDHLYDLRSLETFIYVDEQGKDQGINIRHKAKELMDFIQDDDKLREERKKAKKNKDKYVGMSNDNSFGGRIDSWRFASRDKDDLDLDRPAGGGWRDADNSGDEGSNHSQDEKDSDFRSPYKDTRSPEKIHVPSKILSPKSPTSPSSSMFDAFISEDFDPRIDEKNKTGSSSTARKTGIDDFGDFHSSNGDFGDFASAFSEPSLDDVISVTLANAPSLFATIKPVSSSTLSTTNTTSSKSQASQSLLDGLDFEKPVSLPVSTSISSNGAQCSSFDLLGGDSSLFSSPPSDVQSNVKRFKDALVSTSEAQVKKAFAPIEYYLPGNLTPQKLLGIDVDREDTITFCESFFSDCLESIISSPWFESVFFEKLILYGPPLNALQVLIKNIQTLNPSRRRDRLINILVKLIKSDSMLAILVSKTVKCEIDVYEIDSLVRLIGTVPVVVSSVCKSKTPYELCPEGYCNLLSDQIFWSIFVSSEALKRNVGISSGFLAKLLSFLFVSYPPKNTFSSCLSQLCALCHINFAVRRFCQCLIRDLSTKGVENFVTMLSQQACCSDIMITMIGKIKQKSDTSIALRRIILVKSPRSTAVLKKCLLSLASVGCLTDVLKELAHRWQTKSSLLYTSLEEHISITKSILICLGIDDAHLDKSFVAEAVIQGTIHYLQNPRTEYRLIGMYMATKTAKLLCPEGPQPEFDMPDSSLLSEFDEIFNMEDICENRNVDEDAVLTKVLENTGIFGNAKALAHRESEPINEQGEVIHGIDDKMKSILLSPSGVGCENDLDSDDDLKPYNSEENIQELSVNPPVYIADLLEYFTGMNGECDEYERVVVALNHAENVVQGQLINENESVASQLLSILVHLENKFKIENFEELRTNTMISIVSIYPKNSAVFLANQFFAENFSISQRMLMLFVLAGSAEKMSSISTIQKNDPRIQPSALEAKTRRFVHPRKSPTLTLNQFSSVASEFFSSLLNAAHRQTTIDFIHKDYQLLTHYFCTLTAFCTFGSSSPNIITMAESLSDLLWSQRLHPEASVRESVIANLNRLLLQVNCDFLLSNPKGAAEWKEYLEHVMQEDPSDLCRKFSSYAYKLLFNIFNVQFHE
ncbi:telomere length regulation protein TEL2 homolog [Artemia franciscana]|uniref:ENTH domain-containing protein n=1 Tax=Artemia franciscana TaxID=6661 RepID=A0AA88L0M3_ARTSF|nr:hypothetical protein QYM36_010896 [Artemia franciscana]